MDIHSSWDYQSKVHKRLFHKKIGICSGAYGFYGGTEVDGDITEFTFQPP